MYKLIIEDDEGKTTVVPLIRDEITIGRKEGNTIRLTERNVSRKHAKLIKSNGAIQIEDLESYNGIKINGERINGRAGVNEGDRIQIGDYQLALKIDKQASADDPRADEKTTPFIREAPEGATIQRPRIQEDKPSRLIVVSSNFAGSEFTLDKPLMVIGRTDDNDIVINHRSISRHHAQILREGTHYHIVDLQSANGVRVNGEDYGKVELRKGDHIDLGHVRLRFVAGNEDFIFIRDADVLDVGQKKNKTAMIAVAAVAGLLLLGGGVLIAKLLSNKPPVQAPDSDAQVAKLALAADTAMAAQNWDEAIAKCDEGLKITPDQPLLNQKRVKAQREKKNQMTFGRYEKAVKDNDLKVAVFAFLDLPDDSAYKQQAQSSYNKVKRDYVKEYLAKARALPPTKCEDIRNVTEEILSVDSSNIEALEIGRKCGVSEKPVKKPTTDKPVTDKPTKPTTDKPIATPKPPVETPKPPVETPKPPVETPKPAGGGDDVEKLLAEAQDDYVHGNYASAIEKAKKANKGGGNPKAWRIIGASSCFLKDKDGAQNAWNKLGTQDRNFLRYVCKRSGIEFQ